MEPIRVGFAFCGSFCTHEKALTALERVKAQFGEVIPIVSRPCADWDTRFGNAHDLLREIERICDKRVIDTVQAAEPIGPKKLLDVLVIAPCTGNTLSKLAAGATDSPVTMAAKAHLRNDRPVVIAMSTNDGLSASGRNIGELLGRKQIYFVPFRQDDPEGKPCSLVADFSQIPDAIRAALEGRQLQPMLLGPLK
jgi:dipicolinate synthase subunit B